MIAIALGITIVVESVIASAILRRLAGLETIAIQLATWPAAQWLLWRTGAFWPIEAGVVLAEALLWRLVLPLSWRRAAMVSLATNGVTLAIALALS